VKVSEGFLVSHVERKRIKDEKNVKIK
jgi:hypothetical protein